MLEFNVADSPGSSIRLRSIPVNQEMEETEAVYLVESPNGATLLQRSLVDFVEITHLMGPIYNKPGFVAAVGGIPDELKIKGGISFSFPCPTLKFTRKMPEDPSQCQHFKLELYEPDKVMKEYHEAIARACKKTRRVSSSSTRNQEEAHNVDLLHPLI